LTRGPWSIEYGGDSLMPVLQALTYYNLVQNFETAAYRQTVHPDANSIGYVFDRNDATVAALWLTQPAARETVRVKAQSAFTVQDLFGRTERITPAQGVAFFDAGR
jgi:hypothetical protein